MDNGRDAFGIRSLNRHTLEQIVAASSAGVLIVDASHPELPVVYANAAYEQLTGFALSDLAGHPWAPLARAAEGDETFAPLKAAIGRGAAYRAPIPDLRKDGTSFTCELGVTPLRGPRGDLRRGGQLRGGPLARWGADSRANPGVHERGPAEGWRRR